MASNVKSFSTGCIFLWRDTIYSFATARALANGTDVFGFGVAGVVLGATRPPEVAALPEAVHLFQARRLAEVVAEVSSPFIVYINHLVLVRGCNELFKY